MPEIRVGKGLGQLNFPFAPAAAEDDLVPAVDLAHRSSILFRQHHGFQIVVGLPLGIGGFHRPGQSLTANKTIL